MPPFILLVVALTSPPVAASSPQEPVTPPSGSAGTEVVSGSRVRPFVNLSTLFDSNINHDAEDLDAVGVVLGVGGIYKNNLRRPTFEVQYQAGLHEYNHTNRWNRVSHYTRAAWDRRLTRHVTLESVGEASIKGSTEDRELSNQFALSPRLSYRLIPSLRLRGYGVWRVKRYEDDPGRNAFDRYGGLEFVGRPRPTARWEAGARYELNATESNRFRYVRWTGYGGIAAPLSRRDRFELEMRYRRARYPYRLVDIPHAPDVPRRDRRVESEAAWFHSVSGSVELHLGYAFDGRDSNDSRREYRSHQVLLGVSQRW